jgi:hypothetical protein
LQLKQLKFNMRAAMETRSRWIAVSLAILGATSFALAVQSAWWSVGEVTIGPFGARHCFGGECRESGLAWIGGSELWMRSAIATRAAGYIAMFVLIAFAGGLAAKREPRIISRGAITAIVTAVATGVYFAAAFPGVSGASIDRGVFMYIAGVVLGVAAVVSFLRSARRS